MEENRVILLWGENRELDAWEWSDDLEDSFEPNFLLFIASAPKPGKPGGIIPG